MDVNKNTTKLKRIHKIFISNPYGIFSKREIYNTFNSLYDDKIDPNNSSKWLTKLWKQNKVFRTPTQTEVGYVYSLKNRGGLNRLYHKYILPYKLANKEELLNLILKNSFETLKTNYKINDISRSNFVKKYGKNHFNKKATKTFLSKLVAFIMGDGHIRKNREGAQFFFREKSDAELFRLNFLEIFYKEKMKVIKREYCYACTICSRYLIKILEILGAPVGNKVFQSFYIPDWIYYSNDNIKLAFLSVIYGNEGSKPQDNRWRIQFVLSKNKKNIKNLLMFLNQIKTMLNHFGISTSFTQLRKQKGRQFCGRFYIKGKENLRKFYKLLEFSYASEKQKVLEDLILKGNSF